MVIDVCCNAHVLHGIVSKTFGLVKFMPRMHSIAFTMGISSHVPLVMRALRKIVERDLLLPN